MRIDKRRLHGRFLVFATTIGTAALLAASGCGSDSTPVNVANTTFIGALGNGKVLTLNFGANTSGSIPITGSLAKTGTATINLTGTYMAATYSMTATGGGYSLTGTQSGTTVSGTYTGGGGSGNFAAFQGDTTSVIVYCGTYAGSASGSWNIVRNGSSAAGAYSTGKLTNGTVSGNSITFSIVDVSAGSGSGTGTISGNSVSGNWTVGSSSGTWTGSTTGC
jgi:hypothetical protein